MKKLLLITTIISAITIISVNSLALNYYPGAVHSLTLADILGYRKETMTISNNESVKIEIDATVEVYVNNAYKDGNYLSKYQLPAGKSKTISTPKYKNTNYGKYSYYIVKNTGTTWGKSGYDY